MELISPAPKPVIPWQGTILGVIGIIQIFISVILIVLILFGVTIGGLISGSILPDLNSLIPSLAVGVIALFAALILIPLFILNIVVTIGIFRGKRWALIITLVFSGFGLLGNLSAFNFPMVLFAAIQIALSIYCLNDPYYNQNKIAYRPEYTPRHN